MSKMSAARLRAAGLLLLEIGLVGVAVWRRIGKDPVLMGRLDGVLSKVRAL